MNKILVEVSVGELLDKISILEIKKEKISNPENLKFINSEYEILKEQFNNNLSVFFEPIKKGSIFARILLEEWQSGRMRQS